MSDRTQWTDADVRAAWREHAVTTLALTDPVTLPWHLRDASRDPHWQPRTNPLPTRHGKHATPEPDDEEPSLAPLVQRQRRRLGLQQRLILWGAAAGVVTVGILAVRSLMGAS